MTNRQEAAEKLDGMFTEASCQLGGGITIELNGVWKKFYIEPGLVFKLGPTQDAEKALEALKATLQAFVGGYLKPIEEHYASQNAEINGPEPGPALHEAPAKSAPREVRTPIDDSGAEYDIFDVASIAVEYSPGGEKRAKVKGGKWAKFGVMCWPEVLSLEPLEWNLDELDAVEYSVPAGLKAKALMVDGKPKKVVEWL